MDRQTERRSKLITEAAAPLAKATTASEILEAQDAGQAAYHIAKVMAACRRAMQE